MKKYKNNFKQFLYDYHRDVFFIPKKRLKQHRAKWKPNKNPLVSIIIATYNKRDQLINDTIPSVLNQTYKNIELIVIGDCCTDGTDKAIKKIKDNRLTFVNLPERTLYPEDAVFRWHVAGGGPFNVGMQLAKGDWVGQINDNDVYNPEAIERLLNHAGKNNLEMVGGKKKDSDGKIKPYNRPAYIGGIFRSYLCEYIKVDLTSWRWMLKPGDKILMFIMLCSGIRFGGIDYITITKQKLSDGRASAGSGLGRLRRQYKNNPELYKQVIKKENELIEMHKIRKDVIETIQRFKDPNKSIDDFIKEYMKGNIKK